MLLNEKILVLGSRGLVGSGLVRYLKKQGYQNILTPTRETLNLLRQVEVEDFFKNQRPEYVLMAAAKVGGIHANNTYRADFIFENLQIQNNIFGAAWKYPVKKLLFLGSSCIYPKLAENPIKEESLLTGPLEPTNEPYAIAKIAGVKTAESFRRQYQSPFYSVMPTNLYGPNDNYDLNNSHVIPGLIARMYLAKKENKPTFSVWGSGKPRREFLHVDDLSAACIFLMNQTQEIPDLLNIGCGNDISIAELATLIKNELHYTGELIFDTSMPDGTMRKRLSIERIKALGWEPKISLELGIKEVVTEYLNKQTL